MCCSKCIRFGFEGGAQGAPPFGLRFAREVKPPVARESARWAAVNRGSAINIIILGGEQNMRAARRVRRLLICGLRKR